MPHGVGTGSDGYDSDHGEDELLISNNEDLPLVEKNARTTGFTSLEQKQWRPFWLRRSTLIVFTLLYALIGGALLVLRSMIRDDNGWALTITSNYYACKYGNTLSFLGIVCLGLLNVN
jgi:hypothetical protein